MKFAMTVTGPISRELMGHCQPHEHLMIRKGESFRQNEALLIDDRERSRKEVTQYYMSGGMTIIDAQPGGCGRMEEELKYISEAASVHIIASTGFHKLIFYPRDHWLHQISEKDLTEYYTQELKTGMFGNCDDNLPCEQNGIRAGIVKTALDRDGLTVEYQRLFNAASEAALSEEVPFMVHIEQGSRPVILLDYLLSKGMPANRILFCHLDREILDLMSYVELLNAGIKLEFDTIGRFKYHSDESEVKLIGKLISLGYEDQLLMSLDTTRKRLKSYTYDAIGLDYILRTFIPMLKNSGISDLQIYKITHSNASDIFR